MTVANSHRSSSASEWLAAFAGWVKLAAWVFRGGLKAD